MVTIWGDDGSSSGKAECDDVGPLSLLPTLIGSPALRGKRSALEDCDSLCSDDTVRELSDSDMLTGNSIRRQSRVGRLTEDRR